MFPLMRGYTVKLSKALLHFWRNGVGPFSCTLTTLNSSRTVLSHVFFGLLLERFPWTYKSLTTLHMTRPLHSSCLHHTNNLCQATCPGHYSTAHFIYLDTPAMYRIMCLSLSIWTSPVSAWVVMRLHHRAWQNEGLQCRCVPCFSEELFSYRSNLDISRSLNKAVCTVELTALSTFSIHNAAPCSRTILPLCQHLPVRVPCSYNMFCLHRLLIS